MLEISKMTCKGICIRHKARKPVGSGRYAIGQKRCQICELFIEWKGLWCPCCGYRLRTRPRNLKYKAKLRARKKVAGYYQARSPTASNTSDIKLGIIDMNLPKYVIIIISEK